MPLIRLLALLALLFAANLAAAAADPKSDEFWYGSAADGTPVVRLYYFYSPTCPHCQAAAPYIDELRARWPWLEVQKYAVKDNRANAKFYYETALSLGTKALSVPGFIFCRQVLIGYDDAATTGAEIAQALDACHQQRLDAGVVGMSATPAAGAKPSGAAHTPLAAEQGGTNVHIPIIGTVDAKLLSLPVLTLVLAGMDAFNPCAFFVLLFLLSLMVHAKSRARMLIVGGTFVLFSGLVYFVFMAAWLNLFLLAGELRAVTVAAGLVALVIGAINVKDYFWFKQGVSLSIPDAAKPGLFRRVREVVAAGATGPMLAGTILLAIVANSYELLCTAGLPMVYTRTLTLAGLPTWQYYAYLAAYNVIYVIPLLVIVMVFAWTLGARKLSESEGRLLKLVSGCMMLAFGILLLAAPHWLTVPAASVGIVALAVVTALVTDAIGRRLQRGKPGPR
jgi:thiol-disulfide isomerase/thioredoxin